MKETEEKLFNMYEWQKAILNGTDYSVISTDPTGIIVSFNKGAEKMLGYSSLEVVNKVSPSIIHDLNEVIERAKVLSKELHSTIEPGFEVFVAKAKLGVTDNNEWTYIRKDKSKLTVELSVTALKNGNNEITGFLGIAKDITNRKIMERKLLYSEQKHRVFFENTQGLMCTHDLKGNFLTINPAGASLIGYSVEDIINKNLKDIVPISAKELVNDYLNEIKKNGFAKGLLKVIHKNGTTRTWMYNNVISDQIDGTKFIIGNAVDITDRIALEKELKNAKLIAEQNAYAKDLFLANMSHEIRTPMNAIIGFGQLLIDTELNSDQLEFVNAINISSENLLGIVNDILDFSKIESGNLDIEQVPVNLKDLLKNINKILGLKSSQKGLNLSFNTDNNIPTYVQSDPTRLNQILINLIGNAIKFTEKGNVTINSKLIEDKPDEVLITFEIIDTGIGIPQNKIDKIFERFTQATPDTNRKYGGTGLGLSISKALIKMLGGTLSLLSTENKGSTFTVTLPFKKINKQVVSKPAEQVMAVSSSQKIHILLVEDNIYNQKLASRVINKFGFEVEIAENGRVAIEKLSNKKYDLVLMDLQMPEMDGYEATIHIRNILKNKVPIIAMTAHSLIGEKEKCDEVGMNDFISKPFNQNDLYNKILKHTENSKSEKNSEPICFTEETEGDLINLKHFRELSGGDIEFEKEMIGLFINQMPIELNTLKDGIARSDFNIIKSISHKIKTSFSLFGVKGSDELSTMEELTKSITNIETIRMHYDIIFSYFEKAIILLRKEIN